MFWALSQNYQHLFEKKYIYASYSELSKELKKKQTNKNKNQNKTKQSQKTEKKIKIKVGQAFFELLIQKQHFDCFEL